MLEGACLETRDTIKEAFHRMQSQLQKLIYENGAIISPCPRDEVVLNYLKEMLLSPAQVADVGSLFGGDRAASIVGAYGALKRDMVKIVSFRLTGQTRGAEFEVTTKLLSEKCDDDLVHIIKELATPFKPSPKEP